ncbi:MAG: hypothetical protein OJF47_001564 [Nitrospira sp.]|nr:MAG: hypothetical protein OJF47_001564 [Nitrospira sp.]
MAVTTRQWNVRVDSLSEVFPKQNEGVHSCLVDGESVLLNLVTGRYYTLNAAGSAIWNLCGGDRPLDRILSAVCERFDVSVRQAQDDLLDLVAQLEQEGLLQTERR